jgi:hypothetical protein
MISTRPNAHHHDDPSLGEAGVKFEEGGEVDDDDKARGDDEHLSPSILRWTIGESEIVGKIKNGKWPLKIETLEIKSLENKNLQMSAVIATTLCGRLNNPTTFLCGGEKSEGFAGVENKFDDQCQEREFEFEKILQICEISDLIQPSLSMYLGVYMYSPTMLLSKVTLSCENIRMLSLENVLMMLLPEMIVRPKLLTGSKFADHSGPSDTHHDLPERSRAPGLRHHQEHRHRQPASVPATILQVCCRSMQ